MRLHISSSRLRATAALLVSVGVAVAASATAAPTPLGSASADSAAFGRKDYHAAVRLGVSATAPSGRYFHAAILDSLRHRMLMFGGHIVGNELWALSLGDAPAWQIISTDPAAPNRDAPVAILDPVRDRIIVFGGMNQSGVLQNDVWAFPLSQNGPWSQLAGVGTPPAPRWLHCGIYDPVRDRLIVFGGNGDLNDVWALSLSGTPTWTQILPSGTAPSQRCQSSAVYDPVRDRMIVIGGRDNQAYFNDTWALSLGDSPQWTPLSVAAAGPDPLSGQSAVYDAARDLIWLFGGRDGAEQDPCRNDLWGLSLFGIPTWVRVSPDGTPPYARAHHSAVLDPLNDRMVVFGGWDRGSRFNDTWFLQLAGVPTWFDINTAPPPPPTQPNPEFLVPIASPGAIVLGQTFTITVRVRNSGLDTDDGRISVSFPALTDPTDGQWVGSSTSGDPSTIVALPAGSSLFSATCQPLAASFLAVECRDGGWLDGESHDLTLTVRPPAGGTFHFYVRATMHAPGTPCTQINGLPAGGQPGFVDQQGFPVVRYAVTVIDTPQPRFTQAPTLSASVIELGQSFTVTTVVQNDGTTSDDGRIVISFPGLTSPTDSAQVREYSGGDPGYREHPAGSPLPDASCQPGAATCLAVEHVDAAWGTGQTYTFRLTATPLTAGTFYLYVRCAMRKAGTACEIISMVPPGGESGYTDQQGFPVARYAVNVVGSPQPIFTLMSLSTTHIEIGQSFSITASVQNDGASSDDGRLVVAFPSLTSTPDSAQVRGYTNDGAEYREYPAGSLLLDASCQPVTAAHLLVEFASAWHLVDIRAFTVTVTPSAAGTFYFYVRCAMHWPGTACQITNVVPPGGESGYTDQQGFPVARYAVNVTRPLSIPRFSLPVDGIPSTLMLGQSFTMGASVINDGGPSDDGRIVVSFPAFTHPGDEQWVGSPIGGDAPGYAERPAGNGLLRANDCQTVAGGYLVAEYDDNSWLRGETNDLALTVTPQETGTFYVDVRATMHQWDSPGCPYANVLPANVVSTAVDQQGWTVARFAVQVLPPGPEPVTTTWSQLRPPAGGPGARFGSSMVYHPGRDALVLNGGSTGTTHYPNDTWVLPMAGASSWTQLAPGGPVPRSRINQSMILNPIEDHLVVFGGAYDFPLNDLAALALSPVVWWFPATPSGPQPSPRSGHSAVYDPLRHRMLVIGGFGDTYLNDVWEYPLPGNGTWTQLTPSGTPMPGRTQHAAVYDPLRDRVLVFGGDGGLFLNDVWELRLGPLIWNRLSPSGPGPDGRRQHSMIYDAVRDRLVVFGGVNLGNRLDDVWALSLGNAPVWTRLFSSTVPPGPRKGHAAVYDPVRDRMVVFGGDVGTNQLSNELWTLAFDSPTPTEVSFGGADVSADRVRLSWTVPDASALQADVERSEVAGQWTLLGAASLEGDRLVFEDRNVAAGTSYGYRLIARGPGSVLDEQWVTVPPRAVLALAGASPNPAPDDLWVAFSLPDENQTTLELFDLKGRLLEQREVGALGIGAHRVALSASRRLPAGVYLVRLVRADQTLIAKACVVR